MREMLAKGEWPADEYFLQASFQTAGRGQTGNSWESEEGKNLLCSVLLPADRNLHFMNIAVSVALHRVVSEVMKGQSGVLKIKWPNDLYCGDEKMAGILVENAIVGGQVAYSIAGIGLNVNQTKWISDAPNPTSMKEKTGEEYDIEQLMSNLLDAIKKVLAEPEEEVWVYYKKHLYRREGFWTFEDKEGRFEAKIEDVLPTGEIVLCDKEGRQRKYGFKQIKYII